MTLFEASPDGPDCGGVYLRDFLYLDGDELLPQIRRKCLLRELDMLCYWFEAHPHAVPQQGKPLYTYPKRDRTFQQLDPNKTIAEQFNRMRVADNLEYPLWFVLNGVEYRLDIRDTRPQEPLFERDRNKDWIA